MDLVGSDLRTCNARPEVELLIAGIVHAYTYLDGCRHVFAGLAYHIRDMSVVVSVCAVDKEDIRRHSAYHAFLIREGRLKAAGDPLQYLVALGRTETLIDDVEMVNIEADRIHVGQRMELVELLSVAVEILARKQSRKRILLRRSDYLPVLRELDRARYPGLDDIGLRIGLRDKIISSQPEALDFRVLVRCEDDHRNAFDIGILLNA